MNVFWYSFIILFGVFLAVMSVRWVRVFIAIRRGPQWRMCPISSCDFAFKFNGPGEEDLDKTRDIMREHILVVHYLDDNDGERTPEDGSEYVEDEDGS